MILSNQCWIKDRCKKYSSAECDNCSKYCIKLFKLDDLYNKALFTLDQRKFINLKIDADGTDREAFMQLKDIQHNIENFIAEGQNLYLHSSKTGNGKTRWCLRLVQAYFDKIWHKSDLVCKALYISVPRFLLALKNNITHSDPYVDHIKENILKADIVIWDEIGTKTATEFEHEHLLSLINTRIDMNKSNLYTSNLSGEALREKIGDRLYSRIVYDSINIEFFGQDKRGLR